ncbi:hypothetical protein B0H14DRAFT_2638964 [Mycena olivaceomarginata]|nr:hypothetical protein B0H14DRAFT_2638964 [Mycena olivaceomarginata]
MHDAPQICGIVRGRHSARLAADARLRRELNAKAKADHRATLRLKRLGQQARCDARATDRASAKAWAAVREALLEPDEEDDDAKSDGEHGEQTPDDRQLLLPTPMSTLLPDLQRGERRHFLDENLLLWDWEDRQERRRIWPSCISYDISCQFRKNLELATGNGESVEHFWSSLRPPEYEEYLALEEIEAWCVSQIEVQLVTERTPEDVMLDTVVERRWVRTFLHVLYLGIHLSNL